MPTHSKVFTSVDTWGAGLLGVVPTVLQPASAATHTATANCCARRTGRAAEKVGLKKSVPKKLIRDLSEDILSDIEKIEGLAVFENKMFLISDNDFGIVESEMGPISIDNTIVPKLIWFEFRSKDKK